MEETRIRKHGGYKASGEVPKVNKFYEECMDWFYFGVMILVLLFGGFFFLLFLGLRYLFFMMG